MPAKGKVARVRVPSFFTYLKFYFELLKDSGVCAKAKYAIVN